MKFLGSDANHGEFFSIELGGLAGQRGIAAEIALPESVAHYHGVALGSRLIRLRRKCPAQLSIHAQCGEVVLRYHLDGHKLAPAFAADEAPAPAIGHDV